MYVICVCIVLIFKIHNIPNDILVKTLLLCNRYLKANDAQWRHVFVVPIVKSNLLLTI